MPSARRGFQDADVTSLHRGGLYACPGPCGSDRGRIGRVAPGVDVCGMTSGREHAPGPGPLWHLPDAELCDGYVTEQREITRMQARAAAGAEVDRRAPFEPEFLTAIAFVTPGALCRGRPAPGPRRPNGRASPPDTPTRWCSRGQEGTDRQTALRVVYQEASENAHARLTLRATHFNAFLAITTLLSAGLFLVDAGRAVRVAIPGSEIHGSLQAIVPVMVRNIGTMSPGKQHCDEPTTLDITAPANLIVGAGSQRGRLLEPRQPGREGESGEVPTGVLRHPCR